MSKENDNIFDAGKYEVMYFASQPNKIENLGDIIFESYLNQKPDKQILDFQLDNFSAKIPLEWKIYHHFKPKNKEEEYLLACNIEKVRFDIDNIKYYIDGVCPINMQLVFNIKGQMGDKNIKRKVSASFSFLFEFNMWGYRDKYEEEVEKYRVNPDQYLNKLVATERGNADFTNLIFLEKEYNLPLDIKYFASEKDSLDIKVLSISLPKIQKRVLNKILSKLYHEHKGSLLPENLIKDIASKIIEEEKKEVENE